MYRLLAIFALVSCAVADTILAPDNIDGRIVGGVNTTIEEHPYQVSVQNNSGFHFCGGSIISEDIVVTAAHCLLQFKADEMQVRLGSTNYNKGGLLVKVKSFRRHELYNPIIKKYDVGLIKLSTPVPQSTTIRYIKLAQSVPSSGTVAIATGWGQKCNNCKILPTILQKVQLVSIDRNVCASNIFAYGDLIKDTMLCALALGKDSCQGDSGGPLVFGNELVGIVSWGRGCARRLFPGVYCNVAEVREWIENTAKEL